MKIEIGESLMLSYLKHVKKCLFYQTNWKISNNWDITNEIYEKVQSVYNKIINHPKFSDIFKKSELNQLIKQSEIDVIGIDSNNTIFTVDIAFHEAGLNYGDKNETKNRIFKKLLRSYLTLITYFPDKKYELLFSSPKVNPAIENIIFDYFKILKDNFSDENVTFKYITNDKFYEEILMPTLSKAVNDSDTNELFIRSIILNNLFKDKLNIQKNKKSSKTIINQDIPIISNKNNYAELILEFEPSNEKIFEQELIRTKKAKRIIYYNNNKKVEQIWNAKNFKGNLRGNIKTNKIIRDWKENGIIKVKCEIIN